MPLESNSSAPRRHFGMTMLWVALIGFDTFAQLLFKTAAQSVGSAEVSWRWVAAVAQSMHFWAAAIALSLTFPIWMLILRRSQVNLAFPATALTYIGVVGGSQLLFGESIGPLQFAGIALIVLGVAMLRRPDG